MPPKGVIWQRAARRALGLPDVVDDKLHYRNLFSDWAQTQFYIPETRKPLSLAPYQLIMLDLAHARDAQGKFLYDLVLWGDIKKSIKSTIAAAVCLHRALTMPWASVKIVANDLKQANSRVFEYLRRGILLNPSIKAQATINNYIVRLNNNSVIEAVPVDPSGEAGGNDDFIEFTELHAAKTKAAERLWAEMTIPPAKHGLGQRWIDTYAGHSGESPILERLYKALVRPENRVHPEYPIYALGRQIALWNTEPRLPWQTPEYYASERGLQTELEFLRIHRNQWVSSVDSFVKPEWWAACQTRLPELDKYREVVVALDAAVSGDCFGVVAVSRHENAVAVRYARKWTAPANGTIRYSNPLFPADPDTPEGVLRQLARDYNVLAVVYDPYQLHDFAGRLGEENLAPFISFNQGGERLTADKALFDMIRERRVMYEWGPGVDALGEHVLNANSKATGDNKLRIEKRSDDLKIDLCVCLSMAAAGAMRYCAE